MIRLLTLQQPPAARSPLVADPSQPEQGSVDQSSRPTHASAEGLAALPRGYTNAGRRAPLPGLPTGVTVGGKSPLPSGFQDAGTLRSDIALSRG